MQKSLLAERDRAEWNAFVSHSRFGHVLQSWEWGELKARAGWKPLRLALHEDGEIRAAAQVLIRPLPLGIAHLAYIPRGPALDYTNQTLLEETLRALTQLAADQNVMSLKLEPDVTTPSELPGLLQKSGLDPAIPVQMRSTIWVDLTASEEEMLARQKQKTRYNIRLAGKKGVVVRRAAPEEIRHWYAMYATTAERDQFTIHSRQYYEDVMAVLGPTGLATLLLAEHDGDLLAGIIVFGFGRTAQYMYGASSNEKRNLMAPYLLQWEGMRWAKSRGALTYDMWGIPDVLSEDESLWGVYRHKRGYGGEIVKYIGAFDLIRSPLRHLAFERVARPLFKRVAQLAT
jgi:lipid II:glycine glycyltransferase (peptidoglycan interpeptide bridge formation enzyme)